MRFDHLNIRAFGHFTDYELLFDPSKNFHLIYGPNEAGKSTTLRSITHFLYGFPVQTNDAFLHSNTKLRIEGLLKKANGQELFFARRKGNKNTVLDGNEKPLNEELVNEFLNGITKEHFLNMFALDHVRLREGGDSLLQSGGNLGESLFSAASGISMLRKVFEDLEKKSGEIYKKKAQTPRLNKLLKEEKELAKDIANCQLKIQAWKDLERTFTESKKKIEDIHQQIKALRSEQEKLKRIKEALPKMAKLREVTKKLVELGEVPNVPENLEGLREAAQSKQNNAQNYKQRAKQDLVELEDKLMKIKIPEGLIEQASLINDLYLDLKNYQDNLKKLPLIQGEYKLLEERVLSFMKEIDSLQAGLDNIDLFRLSAEKKETIRALCKDQPLLEQKFENNKSALRALDDELQLKQEELAKITDLPDIHELENVIDIVKRAGDIEGNIQKLEIQIEEKKNQINEKMRHLPLWTGTYQELVELQIPRLMETVKKFEKERIDFLNSLQTTQKQIKFQKDEIEKHYERIAELEELAEIPSDDNLQRVREHRDKGWKLIRTKLQEGSLDEQAEAFTKGQAIETVYEDSVRNADHVADKMRIEAEKVGIKNKLLTDIEKFKKNIADLESVELVTEEELDKWEEKWKALWRPAGINPLSPEEMREWLEKHTQLKELVQNLKNDESTLQSSFEKKLHMKQALMNVMSKFVVAKDNQSLDELLMIAERYQKKINGDINNQNNLQDGFKEIKRKMENLTTVKTEIKEKMNRWEFEWAKAIEGTHISETTRPTVAESLLNKYEETIKAYDELQKVVNEQISLREQISYFENRVKELLQVAPVQYDEQHFDLVVNRLNADLQQATRDNDLFTSLSEQCENLKARIKKAVSEWNEAEETLNGLFKLAQCDSIVELEQIERNVQTKKEYESKIIEIEEDLLTHGNGRSLQDIMEEAKQIEHDSIELDLEEIKRKLEDLEPQRSQLEQEHGVVKKEYEEKILGNNTASVLGEQKKESLLAQLSNLTEQYIQVKLATALLQKGIEHYRNQNQDPILRRASEIFSRLTLQSFAGLSVDYDEKDQPVLMGVRDHGDKVSINGMSDGTTDQLYLSLRIASIERYANENEPIPLIVDDILVHFDDTRSKETLKILLELSKQTQIIFFTHHARLVEIMKEIATDSTYQITEINSNVPLNV
ncbi:YhaN family protein [Neobacillus massiliamazoniensis]|uniref:p-loop containing nucleoside triphosphate hydrolase n=1 Tax=Neobacillus massiliamazoniensis TaxID=1499688 RepID=A0A0U1NSD9_9BACI|nr:YhaN family protein [Neobacillus massiliamazoniensis]CRK80865.1 P-loop containing nucleoside triphosphate hydrolase [Neobacillus massiliamazoniensis]